MLVRITEYLGSFETLDACPQQPLPEFAFVGRSNVGKSSLINYLCNKKNLARTSQVPGKTRRLHFFLVNHQWRLVDMPGYGYARMSKQQIIHSEQMIKNYLLHRPFLACVFLLIDARIPPQKIDLEFAGWLGANEIPFVIVFTKADKKQADYMEQFKKQLLQICEPLPEIFVTSSAKKKGADLLLAFIEKTIRTIREK